MPGRRDYWSTPVLWRGSGEEGEKKSAPTLLRLPTTGAPRRHGARAEVGGEREPGARPVPPPSSPGKRDGARERRARPGEAPEPSGKREGFLLLPLTPPPPPPGKAPRAPTGRACAEARARDPPSRADAAAASPPRRTPTPAAWPRPGWWGGGAKENERKAPPRSRGAPPEEAEERTEEPAVGRRAERDLGRPPADLGYRRRPPPPLPERARPRAPARQPRVHPRKMKPASRVGPRRPAAPAVPPRFRVVREKRARKEDKPLCRGLTLNRSQRGSCSATYETPTQKQVVYEWFSARFHTNVRST